MTRRVLITGVGGFVGANLIDYCRSNSYEVIKIGRNERINWQNLEETVISADVYIHTAGIAHDVGGRIDEREYIDVNVGLTQKIFIQFLNDASAKTFVYFSSIKSAGEFANANKFNFTTISEDYIGQTNDIYGKSKRIAEEWLLNQNLPKQKNLVILRPVMIYGINQRSNLFILTQHLLKGRPVLLREGCGQRSYLSLSNLFFVINEILVRKEITSGIYHLCDDDTISTLELSELIEKINNRKFWKICISDRQYYLLIGLLRIIYLKRIAKSLEKMNSNFLVSNSKIKSELGITVMPNLLRTEMNQIIKEMSRIISDGN